MRLSQVAILPALLGSKEGYKSYREKMDGWAQQARRPLRGESEDGGIRAVKGLFSFFHGDTGKGGASGGVQFERGN